MHQTDQMATVEWEITTWKSLRLSGVCKHRCTNCPDIFLFYNQGLLFSPFALLHTRNDMEEWGANERKEKKNRELVFSRCCLSRIRTSCWKSLLPRQLIPMSKLLIVKSTVIVITVYTNVTPNFSTPILVSADIHISDDYWQYCDRLQATLLPVTTDSFW